MNNFCIFADALNFIEEHLCCEISQEDIADACFCSLSNLQKIWRYCSRTSLKEYISKRRLTNAAYDLVHSGLSVTETAFKYQYNSPEVFTRAFTKLWGTPPSKFRSQWRFTGIFPKLIPDENVFKTGGNIMQKRNFDISELYDELKAKSGTYVLCFDIAGLDRINKEIGRKAGDMMIAESLKRIDSAAEDGMFLFRIGGDEFAMVTGLSDKEETRKLAQRVLAQNGGTISCNGTEVPCSLRAGAYRFENRSLRYSELFSSLQDTINIARNCGEITFIG